jgi:mRNA interferase MazF
VQQQSQLKRGQIYMFDFGKIKGSEIAGEHPALIVQNDVGNKYAPTTIIIAIHGNYGKQELPICVRVKAGTSGLTKDSIIDTGHILTIDKRHVKRFLGMLPDNIMSQVDIALKNSLQIR